MENKAKTASEIMQEFESLSDAKKIKILFSALNNKDLYKGRSNTVCIALAMGYEYDGLDAFTKPKY